jgi:hypothetical protein
LSTAEAHNDVGAGLIIVHNNGKEERFEFLPRKNLYSMIKNLQEPKGREKPSIRRDQVRHPSLSNSISF